jgi:outer membrane protein OmpA-like peptidoglycan-associated protein
MSINLNKDGDKKSSDDANSKKAAVEGSGAKPSFNFTKEPVATGGSSEKDLKSKINFSKEPLSSSGKSEKSSSPTDGGAKPKFNFDKEPVAPKTSDSSKSNSKAWVYILLLLVIGGGLFYFLSGNESSSNNTGEVAEVTLATTESAVAPAGDAADNAATGVDTSVSPTSETSVAADPAAGSSAIADPSGAASVASSAGATSSSPVANASSSPTSSGSTGNSKTGSSGAANSSAQNNAIVKPSLMNTVVAEFTFGSTAAQLKDPALVDQLANYLTANPNSQVVVAGYTSSDGAVDANERLSQLRAEAFMQMLVAKGVGESRIKAVGKGIANPIGDNSTPEGRARNRRVEVSYQ